MTNTKISAELLPCPFCGGDADLTQSGGSSEVDGYTTFHTVHCKSCGVSKSSQSKPYTGPKPEEAIHTVISAWNSRHQGPVSGQVRDILNAVAHVGVDFGYGPYAIEEKFIKAAQQILASRHQEPVNEHAEWAEYDRLSALLRHQYDTVGVTPELRAAKDAYDAATSSPMEVVAWGIDGKLLSNIESAAADYILDGNVVEPLVRLSSANATITRLEEEGRLSMQTIADERARAEAAEAERDALLEKAQALLDHWDERDGAEKRGSFEGVEYWSPAGRMVDTQFIADLRKALEASK